MMASTGAWTGETPAVCDLRPRTAPRPAASAAKASTESWRATSTTCAANHVEAGLCQCQALGCGQRLLVEVGEDHYGRARAPIRCAIAHPIPPAPVITMTSSALRTVRNLGRGAMARDVISRTFPRKGRNTRDAATRRPCRFERGWGPITGGQLTAILITLAVVIGFPVTAFAVTGSSVFVTDSHSGVHAAVNAAGGLSVAGTVTATPSPPNASYTNFTEASELVPCDQATPPVPAGRALVVTSITVMMASGTGPIEVTAEAAHPGSSCALVSPIDEVGIAGSGQSQTFSLPSGVPVKAGQVVGLSIGGGSGDALLSVGVHGYLVSSHLCTVSGPPAGCI